MSSSRLKVALAVSLAVNLFAIGAVVGAAGMQARLSNKAPQATSRSSGGSSNALMRASEVLPESKRGSYLAQLKAQGEFAQDDYKAARAARVRASDMIAAPIYDRPAIAALLAEARAHDVTARMRFENAVIDFAAGLTAAERKALGERLKPGYRSPDSKGKQGDGDREKSPSR